MNGLRHRLRSRLFFGLLLPYAVLAIAAQFLHTCGLEDSFLEQAAACVSSPAGGSAHAAFGPAALAAPRVQYHHGPCPACMWAASSNSNQQHSPACCGIVPHVVSFPARPIALYGLISEGLFSIRAPPQV